MRLTWVNRLDSLEVSNSLLIVLHQQVQFRPLHECFGILVIYFDGSIKVLDGEVSLVKFNISASTIIEDALVI